MKEFKNYDQLLMVINEEMADKQFTQTELAEALNLKQPYINRLLKRKNIPSIEVVLKIVEFLGIKLTFSTQPSFKEMRR